MKNAQLVFQPGDCVKVKPGVKDPDWGADIGDWQGCVLGFDKAQRGKDTVLIQWDSITLRDMPLSMIERCDER